MARNRRAYQDEAFFEEIFESLPLMAFLKDARTFRFVRINARMLSLFGVTRSNVIGKTDYDLHPKAHADLYRQKDLAALASDGVVVTEEEPNDTESGSRWMRTHKVAVRDADGNPKFLLGISEDITQMVHLRTAFAAASGLPRADTPEPPASHRMEQVLALADLAAKDNFTTVLLLGETGAGKGWLARRIHRQSPRAASPFLEVNCATLPPPLLESELFGHERGAFTGADQTKPGLLEVATGGTLFLDEVADLRLSAQAQLLTFLDEGRFRRVGGTKIFQSDVRLIAATNADLAAAVAKKKFRQDLFYRLNVVPMTIPPLRERREEIPHMAQTITRELALRRGGRGATLTPEVLRLLVNHSWPGNVRELRNALERALLFASAGPLKPEHFALATTEESLSNAETLEAVERRHIERVLGATGHNKSRAAESLGISRSTLKRKLAQHTAADRKRRKPNRKA